MQGSSVEMFILYYILNMSENEKKPLVEKCLMVIVKIKDQSTDQDQDHNNN